MCVREILNVLIYLLYVRKFVVKGDVFMFESIVCDTGMCEKNVTLRGSHCCLSI